MPCLQGLAKHLRGIAARASRDIRTASLSTQKRRPGREGRRSLALYDGTPGFWGMQWAALLALAKGHSI